jgi:hypothetical protein
MGSALKSHLTPIAATARRGRARGSLPSIAVLLGALLAGLTLASAALASEPGRCPNEALRVGPSKNLPDCRAYELVTPAEKGRTQDMTFNNLGDDKAVPSSDGEHIALDTLVPLETAGVPASIIGAEAVFSRTASGWQMKSVVEPGTSAHRDRMELFSPNLAQVALGWDTELNGSEPSPDETLEVGPVGGPYARVAEVPYGVRTDFVGANAGVPRGEPAFSQVLFESQNHSLPSAGSERARAEETNAGATELYDFTEGSVRLVNLTSEGTLLNRCGARLGEGNGDSTGEGTSGAVSADGSRIFFKTLASGPTCEDPSRLYERLNDKETVEVSAPQGVLVGPAERGDVYYDGATADGSKVFFSTVTPLTAGETFQERKELKLFVYDSEEEEGNRLKLIAPGIDPVANEGPYRSLVISEDGSTAYYETGEGIINIFHYDIATGESTFVATVHGPGTENEPSYVTPSGEFLVFAAHGGSGLLEEDGVAGESRGARHTELYRYDAADRSVTCVSCGSGVAPLEGEMQEPTGSYSLRTLDATPALIPISENGQDVFFQTTQRLVPQDTNSTEFNRTSRNGDPGMDVYEWVAPGAEEGPGVFCRAVNGCTHMLSSGGDAGPAVFLGASRDGSNVFFATAARLAPQDMDEYTDIYDARVDGGFAPSAAAVECLSCQGVGSPAPLFSAGASLSFSGPGNPSALLSSAPAPLPVSKPVACRRGYVKSKGRCVKQRVKRRAKRSSVRVERRGK